jgi:hypothetical protein
MIASKRKSSLFVLFTLFLILGLLCGVVYTLKKNLEPPQESVFIVGPAEYINPDANPINATIGVQVINVGNLDLTTGIYFMDFYLTIICDRPCQPEVDIINATSAPEIEPQFVDTQGDLVHGYRVRANLITYVDVDNYPFDEQILTLSIGDKQGTRDDIIFNADPSFSGWAYTQLHVLGWSFRNQMDVATYEDGYTHATNFPSRPINPGFPRSSTNSCQY